MIHKEQRKKLKEVLGYHYTKDVLRILKAKNITTRRGTVYGASMIRNVFTGLNENKDIEDAIMELFIQTQEDTKKTFDRRNQILGLAGSKNNTSG
jgi:hypothetical protein